MNTKVAQFYLVWSEHKNLLKYANLADDKIVINALGRDLVGQHLTIATTQNPPLNYAEWENGKWIGKGIAFEFIKYIQDRYPFNYTVTVPPDIVLGNKTAGVFGLMGDQKADIAAAFFTEN
uniref:Ionotropic glutamate receptor L-glutamate and glycine-binding domain-containing protein n=2 Tax=Photinus pyralis TaxID=7054 RepID=A0A1Y1KGI1_PHOPY